MLNIDLSSLNLDGSVIHATGSWEGLNTGAPTQVSGHGDTVLNLNRPVIKLLCSDWI